MGGVSKPWILLTLKLNAALCSLLETAEENLSLLEDFLLGLGIGSQENLSVSVNKWAESFSFVPWAKFTS